MLYHLVWFEFMESASPLQINDLKDAILSLKSSIPNVVDIRFGAKSPTIASRTPHTHCLTVIFKNASDLPIYDQHPAHQHVVKTFVLPLKKTVNAIDFEDGREEFDLGSASHGVWFDFTGASVSQLKICEEAILNMKGKIPCVLDLAFGKNITSRTPHTHGLIVSLANTSDETVYDAHPAHKEAVESGIMPILKSVNALDFDYESSRSYDLFIGQRNYSSWSLRPWLLMTKMGLQFVEKEVDVAGKGYNTSLLPVSPSGLVPCLHANTSSTPLAVWESLSIIEFLHERHPLRGIWPADADARARARSVSSEMACGFQALRGEMPCNIKLKLEGYPKPYPDALAKNIARIEALVIEAREQFGSKAEGRFAGPFLFGAFCAADAMYTPVATRFRTYNVTHSNPIVTRYFEALLSEPDFLQWEAAALQEEGKGRALQHYDETSILKGGKPRV
jgi:glutathione S-transferase